MQIHENQNQKDWKFPSRLDVNKPHKPMWRQGLCDSFPKHFYKSS